MMRDELYHKGLRRKLFTHLQSNPLLSHKALKVMEKIPRHLYMDSAFEGHAYQDKAFSIGYGQTISQPTTVAYQTTLLEIKEGDKVLEIGTGSGYQATVLHLMKAKVFTIEFQENLFTKTSLLFKQLGLNDIRHFRGDGSKGLALHAPYDKIIFTAAAPFVPTELVKQLKVGGMIVIPVGTLEKQKMLRITKTSSQQLKKETFDDFSFVPLLGKNGWKKS